MEWSEFKDFKQVTSISIIVFILLALLIFTYYPKLKIQYLEKKRKEKEWNEAREKYDRQMCINDPEKYYDKLQAEKETKRNNKKQWIIVVLVFILIYSLDYVIGSIHK